METQDWVAALVCLSIVVLLVCWSIYVCISFPSPLSRGRKMVKVDRCVFQGLRTVISSKLVPISCIWNPTEVANIARDLGWEGASDWIQTYPKQFIQGIREGFVCDEPGKREQWYPIPRS